MSDITPDALGHPLEFPPEFKQWLADYVALQTPKFPISQVFGYALQRARSATVDTSEASSSTAYGNLATVGPTLSNLASGFYLLVFGFDGNATSANAHMFMSPSINGAAAVDADSCEMQPLYPASALTSNVRVLMVQLNGASGVNEVIMKYRMSGNSGNFSMRFLHAIKVFTLDA